MQKNFDLIVEAGVTKPPSRITVEDKHAIVQSVALQRVILNALAELTQFREGFQCLGVGKMAAEHSELLQHFYVNLMKPKVTAGVVVASYSFCYNISYHQLIVFIFV